MRYLLAFLLLAFPAAAGAQTVVQQNAAQALCGTTCGAAAGTTVATGFGNILSLNAVNGSTAGYAVLYDAATVPADGALTPSLIRACVPIAANTGIITPFQSPVQFYYGVSFFVSSNSCTTKAAVTYGYVAVQVRQVQQ